ncbi:SAM-dependent methyltransferase [Streptomyces sp. NPDC058391]|uniref:SAM-dependent methyltransferase n=1 Tax=Streptomyces sp. NPDC058391 TaxID=3346476 RepID=UPI0036490A4D
MHGEEPRTQAIDISTPSVARMYDWLLGGVNNYSADRAACAQLLQVAPSTQRLARNNRSFLGRVVRILAEEYGIDQFLDHGSGLPAEDNVHQIAQRINPGCRVAYIDNDPMVLAHGRTVLHENHNTMIVEADLRDTPDILRQVDGFLDLKRPIAALFVSVLHCLPDTDDKNDPAAVVKTVAQALEGGGFMVICQLVSSNAIVRKDVTALMRRVTKDRWGRVRQHDEVRSYFDGMTIIDPGLQDVVDWRPDTPPPPPHLRPTDWIEWGGVARL